ncbi:MAG TPA: 30S ribosomal protein S9 [Bacteroidales bacterium]|nr:30S ribosomal protein S9 [Bacteroidales bacterium]HPS46255.1 30S ribosomal protein S9 [Bacteroidales bacterium]HQI45344.1 30S ribosomal protein S9 [Bacteroidales bacterium]
MEIINALGRRKNAIARVFIKDGNGTITVNKKDYKEYFPIPTLQYVINQPLELAESAGKYDIMANIDGGGVTGQAEALKLAIARALCKINPDIKPVLKAKGLMTRDPRMVERKKPGQKKARKRFQFSKR